MVIESGPVNAIIPLDIEIVKTRLKTSRFGQKIFHLSEIPSTNLEAKNLLEAGCEEGTVVVAEIQTRGRGRLDRTWHSPPGGLWLSIIVKPSTIPIERMPVLSLMAGTAVAEVIKGQFNLEIDLKWPNDIMYEGKKLGGILTESIFSGAEPFGIIIGIGLNIIQDPTLFPEEFRDSALTLRSILTPGTEISREEILIGILTQLELNYDKLISGELDGVLDSWRRMSSTIGKRVKIQMEDDSHLIGSAIGIDGNGALILATDGGTEHTVIAGDCKHIEKDE